MVPRFTNQHNVQMSRPISKRNKLDYKKNLRKAAYKSAIKDLDDINKIENSLLDDEIRDSEGIERIIAADAASRRRERQQTLQQEREDRQRIFQQEREDRQRIFQQEREDRQRILQQEMEDRQQLLQQEMEDRQQLLQQEREDRKNDTKKLFYRLQLLINRRLIDLDRPIERVDFIVGDGPPPTLPEITNIYSINEMCEEDVETYLRGYGVEELPDTFIDRKRELAKRVGFNLLSLIR